MKALLFLVLIVTFSQLAYSQTQDTTLVRIETRDGNEYVGTIVTEDSEKLVLKTETLGNISIPISEIKSRETIRSKQVVGGKVWFENPQSTRYFWAPNGYGLKKGEGYYQNIYVFWNQFAVGVTDNFSIGGTIVPTFLLGGGPTPIFISPKFSVPIAKEKFNLGLGALAGTVLGEDAGGFFGIVYGTATIGSPDKNFSFGMGYGFADGQWADVPLLNLDVMIRISDRWYFISENYFISVDGESIGALGLGGRWLIQKASLDFIFAIPMARDMGTFIAFPLIGFTIPFGKN